jgi:hypothetical protein
MTGSIVGLALVLGLMASLRYALQRAAVWNVGWWLAALCLLGAILADWRYGLAYGCTALALGLPSRRRHHLSAPGFALITGAFVIGIGLMVTWNIGLGWPIWDGGEAEPTWQLFPNVLRWMILLSPVVMTLLVWSLMRYLPRWRGWNADELLLPAFMLPFALLDFGWGPREHWPHTGFILWLAPAMALLADQTLVELRLEMRRKILLRSGAIFIAGLQSMVLMRTDMLRLLDKFGLSPAEQASVTTAVRAQLRAAGVLTGNDHSVATVESLKWTQEDRRRVENYRPGDVLTFHHTWGQFRKFDTVSVIRQEGRQLVLRATDGRELRIDPRHASGFEVGSTNEISLAVGDRLLIRANVKPADLRNGDLVEIAGIDQTGEISLKDGRVLPAWFRGFTHGYATTSHASQGKTVDRGLLLMADAGIAAGNLKQAYVSNSRFRESQMIYTSDRAAAREAMMRTADRKLALELVGAEQIETPAPRRSWRALWAPRVAPSLSPKAA